MHLIGRGRNARETYPSTGGGAGGGGALQNRLIAPFTQLAGFTPGAASLIGAVAVTPRASGIFLLTGIVTAAVVAAGDVLAAICLADTGPDLTVSGGSFTVNGWHFGTTVPPVVGGTPTPQASPISVWDGTVAANGTLSLGITGMNAVALPLGIPSVITITLGENGGGHAIGAVAIQASLIELP